jgi:hypothetical protein
MSLAFILMQVNVVHILRPHLNELSFYCFQVAPSHHGLSPHLFADTGPEPEHLLSRIHLA